MKYLSVVFSLCFFLFLNVQVEAQHSHGGHSHDDKKEEAKKIPARSMIDFFMVYGNCGMCKKRIEGSLADVKGVHAAEWDIETKVITVQYDDDVITLDEIKKKIGAVGHDTDKIKAEDKVYSSLPGCCQYERPNN